MARGVRCNHCLKVVAADSKLCSHCGTDPSATTGRLEEPEVEIEPVVFSENNPLSIEGQIGRKLLTLFIAMVLFVIFPIDVENKTHLVLLVIACFVFGNWLTQKLRYPLLRWWHRGNIKKEIK